MRQRTRQIRSYTLHREGTVAVYHLQGKESGESEHNSYQACSDWLHNCDSTAALNRCRRCGSAAATASGGRAIACTRASACFGGRSACSGITSSRGSRGRRRSRRPTVNVALHFKRSDCLLDWSGGGLSIDRGRQRAVSNVAVDGAFLVQCNAQTRFVVDNLCRLRSRNQSS